MKITLCKGQFLGPISGADETIVTYATHLHRAGHSVSVLLLYPYSSDDHHFLRLQRAGVRVDTLASNSMQASLRASRSFARRLLRVLPWSDYVVRLKGQMIATNIASRYFHECYEFLRSSHSELVHVITPDPGAMMMIKAAHAAGIPVLYQELGIPYHPPRYESYYQQFTSILPLCAEIAALSPLLAEECRRKLPNWRRLSVLPIISEDPSNGHHSTSTRTQRVTVGFAGRMEHLKGPLILLEAFAAAARGNPKLMLRTAGAGSLEQKLVSRARELGVADNCEFTGVYSTTAERTSFMRRLDIFALPSLTEGTPNSIIEGMSHGLPIIASNVGGIPDVVGPDSGILIPPKDPHALKNAIERLSENAELRHEMGRAARERYLKLFSPETVLPVLLNTYERVAAVGVNESKAVQSYCEVHPWSEQVYA